MSMRTILVTNVKGGCGKTTTATNLAAAYANSGMRTALADIDRQRSSLDWLKRRGDDLAPIEALDWRRESEKPGKKVQRLIVDSPAAMRNKIVRELLKEADALVVPLQPSVLDETSTRRFIKAIRDEKAIVKGRLPVYFVLNRIRPRTNALRNAIEFLTELEYPPTIHVNDRAIYDELIGSGLGVFDHQQKRMQDLIQQWQPLLSALERDFARP
jgi:chromosome partitioning protein